MTKLDPYELKDALVPGLFPDEDTAPEWDGLGSLGQEHAAAIEAVQAAQLAYSALASDFRAEDANGQVTTDPAERDRRLHSLRVERDRAIQQAEATVSQVVDEARELLPDWRAAHGAAAAARRDEAEQLRARLVELEAEDLTARRLEVWLDRLDPDRVMPGLYPWTAMAATPEPPHLPVGPIARTFQPNPQEATPA